MIFIIKGFRIIVLTLFPQRFGRYVLWPPSGVCLTTSYIESTGVTCFDSVSHNRVLMLSIPVLLFACSQDWTRKLEMIVSLEAYGTNALFTHS